MAKAKTTKKKTSKAPAKKAATSKTTTKRAAPKKSGNQALAIVGLILNVILMPGLGSLIGSKIKEGIWQLVLLFGSLIVAVILFMTVIGIPLGVLVVIIGPLAAWIWGIVTGVQMIKESS